jgi:hypothetical protein
MFEFIKRTFWHFNDINYLKVLYFKLIRSIVEYGSLI